MKLNMIFIVMDLLTLLIYPFVFIHGRFRRLVKVKEAGVPGVPLPVALVILNK